MLGREQAMNYVVVFWDCALLSQPIMTGMCGPAARTSRSCLIKLTMGVCTAGGERFATMHSVFQWRSPLGGLSCPPRPHSWSVPHGQPPLLPLQYRTQHAHEAMLHVRGMQGVVGGGRGKLSARWPRELGVGGGARPPPHPWLPIHPQGP